MLSRYLKIVGYIIAFFGILIVAFANIGIWAGKYFGFSAQSVKPFSMANFAAMLIIVGLAMSCFWIADWLDKRAGREPDHE